MTDVPDPQKDATLEALNQSLADRYRVERQIGSGGMATVYLAQDLRHNRKVAIKVLRPELAAAVGAERFRREIEIAAGLHHPHILPLFDSGATRPNHPERSDPEGREVEGPSAFLYYVMPFEDGPTARTLIENDGQIPVPTVIRIMREVADALAHAHAKGVAHRDIKPDNVLISGQHALVTDFGIAKALAGDSHPDAAEGAAANLTMAGSSIGTPAYMAPEQIAGDAATDHRADIYALGIVGYEMLAGVPPFTGATSQQVMASHLTEAPAPLATHRSDVPPAFESIIMRCLAKEPDQRYQSASELVAALEALERGSGPATSKLVRLRRFWPVAAAAVLLIAVAGLFWYRQSGRFGTLIGGDVLAANDLVMVAEFTNRTNDPTLAATVTDAVRIELQESPIVKVLGQREMFDGMTRMELVPGTTMNDTQLRELAERLGVKAFVVGDVAPLGKGYQLTARVVATVEGKESLEVLSTAADAAALIGAVSDLAHKLRSGIGESLRSVANAPKLASATTSSLPALKAYTAAIRADNEGHRPRAIELARQAVTLDSTFAAAWEALAVLYLNSGGENAHAREAGNKAFRWRDRVPERQRLTLMGNYYTMHGKFDSAEQVIRQSTELYNRGWISFADVLLNNGQLAAAESAATRGVAENPLAPAAYWNLIEAQVAQRQFAAAESTLTLARDSLGESGWTRQLAVAIMAARGDYDSLRPHLDSLIANSSGNPFWDLYSCPLDLLQGRVSEWQRCSSTTEVELVHSNPLFVIAELRMTGDSARARRRLAAIERDQSDSSTHRYPLLVAGYAELGMIGEARTTLARWRSETGPEDPEYRLNLPFAKAAIAKAEGKLDSAATEFLKWNRNGSTDAVHLYNRGLVEAGMALDQAGKSDSAMVLYQRALSVPSISGGFGYETSWYPEVLRRLGELYEARGDKQQALGYYSRFLDLWKNADPVLRPQVDAVRARVAALSGEQ